MAKAPNIGIEPSEIMAAAAMLMKDKDIEAYHKNGFNGLVEFIKTAKKLAGDGDKFVFGEGLKSKAMKVFQGQDGGNITNTNPPYNEWLAAVVQGMSASKSIRAWAPARAKEVKTTIKKNLVCDKVFLTGNSWPAEVKKFEVKAYGFKSYNSSDIILKFPISTKKGLAYFGISLKKKPSVESLNPPLINKAFDSILRGESTKEKANIAQLKLDIQKARIKYFAKVFREAVTKEKYLKIVKGGGKIPSSDQQIWDGKVYGEGIYKDKNNPKGIKWKAKEKIDLINIKGKGNIDFSNPLKQKDPYIFQVLDGKTFREFKKGELKNIDKSMRAFFNARVASNDSIYQDMIPVMNKYSDMLGQALLNLVLKKNLYKHLDENVFAFALITAPGDVDKEGNPKELKSIPAKGLYTVLCGLSALMDGGKTNYRMIYDKAKNTKSDAAKVFLTLMKGNLPIIDLQLRYKGDFKGQPQYTATLTYQFIRILTEEYGKKCEVPN